MGNSYNLISGEWIWSDTPTPNSANILSPGIKEKKEVLAEEESGPDGLSAENQLPLFLSALTLAIVSGTSLLFFKKRATK